MKFVIILCIIKNEWFKKAGNLFKNQNVFIDKNILVKKGNLNVLQNENYNM